MKTQKKTAKKKPKLTQGWICPRCQAVNAPDVKTCGCAARDEKQEVDKIRKALAEGRCRLPQEPREAPQWRPSPLTPMQPHVRPQDFPPEIRPYLDPYPRPIIVVIPPHRPGEFYC